MATEPDRVSWRKRRAIALAAGAAIVVVVAGLIYLRPSSPTATPGAAAPAANLSEVTPDYVLYDFPSAKVAWALGFPRDRPGVFSVSRTVDGATHWQRRLTGDHGMTGSAPVLIQFFDEKHGFVATGDGLLRRTSDGGATWKGLSIPETKFSFIRFTDERRGLLMARVANGSAGQPDQLYATEDAGDSWRRLPNPPASGWLISLRGTSEAWLASGGPEPPRAYRSIDGGLSWQRSEIPIDRVTTFAGPWTTSVILLPGEGVLAWVFCECSSPNGFMFTSFDGGATWRFVPDTLHPGLLSRRVVAYQDDFHWWFIEAKTLYRSADAGQTWIKVSDQLPDWAFMPRAVDHNHGWAQIGANVGNFYGLAITNDAGLHWNRVTIPKLT